MKKHAESIHGSETLLARLLQERGKKRHIDNIGDNRSGRQWREIDPRGGRAFHAERRGVDEKPGSRHHLAQGFLRMRTDVCAEAVGQFSGLVERPVDDTDGFETPVSDRLDNGPACTAGTIDDGSVLLIPTGSLLIEIGSKAKPVGVGRMDDALFQPQRVRSTKLETEFVRMVG